MGDGVGSAQLQNVHIRDGGVGSTHQGLYWEMVSSTLYYFISSTLLYWESGEAVHSMHIILVYWEMVGWAVH